MKRRQQLRTADRSFNKCFLSSALNSILFLKILMFSFSKSSQVFGKLTKGCLESDASLKKVQRVDHYYEEYVVEGRLVFSLRWLATLC